MTGPRVGLHLRRAAVAAISLFTISCAAYWSRHGDWAGDRIIFPHERHEKAKVDCLVCHEEVYDATALDKSYRPTEDKCLECHREEKEKGNCAMCHTDVKRARPQVHKYAKSEPSTIVSHAAHLDRTREDCRVCHEKLPEAGVPAQPPTMQSCLGCHEHSSQFKNGQCDVCHKDLGRYGLKPLSSFSHQGDYVRAHGRDARAAVDRCAQCHEQSSCTDCHAATVSTRIEIKNAEKVGSNFIHRNDFITRHAMDAQIDQTQCRRCHGSTFCETCHAAQQLSPSAGNPRTPHPRNYALPGSPDFHGAAARRDITSCAACHDQGARSICVDCHKVGGSGGNPHPPAWSDRHPRSEIQSNGMCLVCHL